MEREKTLVDCRWMANLHIFEKMRKGDAEHDVSTDFIYTLSDAMLLIFLLSLFSRENIIRDIGMCITPNIIKFCRIPIIAQAN